MKPDESVIPQIIKDALKHEDLTQEQRPFEYSATVLCKSPRQVQLERRHKDEFDEPTVLDNWYAFAGSAMHQYLENNLRSNPRYLVEQRIIRFDKPVDGKEEDYRRVGAKFDAYDKETKTLYDHKTTTTFIYGSEMKPEWIKQLMINAYFLEKEGFPVDKVAINAIYMDWRDAKLKYAKDGEYPPAPCTAFECPAWSVSDMEALYKGLLKEHIEAENVPDDDLPFCDPKYCWETPAKFAVYKPGGAKAIKLCNSIEEAKDYIKFKGLTGVEVEERPAVRRRCQDYCKANKFCNQYQQWLKKYAKGSEKEV